MEGSASSAQTLNLIQPISFGETAQVTSNKSLKIYEYSWHSIYECICVICYPDKKKRDGRRCLHIGLTVLLFGIQCGYCTLTMIKHFAAWHWLHHWRAGACWPGKDMFLLYGSSLLNINFLLLSLQVILLYLQISWHTRIFVLWWEFTLSVSLLIFWLKT